MLHHLFDGYSTCFQFDINKIVNVFGFSMVCGMVWYVTVTCGGHYYLYALATILLCIIRESDMKLVCHSDAL